MNTWGGWFWDFSEVVLQVVFRDRGVMGSNFEQAAGRCLLHLDIGRSEGVAFFFWNTILSPSLSLSNVCICLFSAVWAQETVYYVWGEVARSLDQKLFHD
jgi:hypothetical protein